MDRMTDGSSNGTMTDNAMILKKLSEILRRYVEPDPETGDPIVITEETDIFEDLGADSLMVMQIIIDGVNIESPFSQNTIYNCATIVSQTASIRACVLNS